jgi:hypothetical protein
MNILRINVNSKNKAETIQKCVEQAIHAEPMKIQTKRRDKEL